MTYVDIIWLYICCGLIAWLIARQVERLFLNSVPSIDESLGGLLVVLVVTIALWPLYAPIDILHYIIKGSDGLHNILKKDIRLW
jgi:hypothetical protein